MKTRSGSSPADKTGMASKVSLVIEVLVEAALMLAGRKAVVVVLVVAWNPHHWLLRTAGSVRRITRPPGTMLELYVWLLT